MRRKGLRRPFDFRDYTQALSADRPHQASRILFEWLADDGDRAALYRQLKGGSLRVPSRAHFENDPAPPLTESPAAGHEQVLLVMNPTDIAHILENRRSVFSNRPYRLLGTGSFMLGLDAGGTPEWHALQRGVGRTALDLSQDLMKTLTALAWEQAALTSLARKNFDLADLAEQAALRFCGLLFGFAASDHALLEDALRRAYRALTYLNLGRHFVSEPQTLPLAREAMARLMARTDELLNEYSRLERYPDRASPDYAPQRDRHHWPAGVTPPHEYGLTGLTPLLKAWSQHQGELSGEQLAVLAVGMLAGIVGNVQASICIAVDHILSHCSWPACAARLLDVDDPKRDSARAIVDGWTNEALRLNPPVPFLPRLALKKSCLPSGATIDENQQLVLCVGAATACKRVNAQALVFGGDPAVHWCIGKHLALPLVQQIVCNTLALSGLAQRLDAVTGEPLRLEKRWGFACERYPLEYRRDRRLAQQPLQVIMRIKAPVADNAARLRRLIRDGAPKIERALREARHVHFAWFQLIEGDTQLVLQTVYDGDFDAYIQHFALKVDDVFDQLFQYIEDAPPLPVSDFPEAFVETIRRYNRAPLAGYFFSAYPHHEAWNILRRGP